MNNLIPGKFYRLSIKKDFIHRDSELYLRFDNGEYSKNLLRDKDSSIVILYCKNTHKDDDFTIKFFYEGSYYYDYELNIFSSYNFEEL